jgi:hypothetical protein
MNHDQLALFLASCTTAGFRRSLSAASRDALTRCGFDPAESDRIAASLARFPPSSSGPPPELAKVAWTFRQISHASGGSGKAFRDDWYSH